MLSEYLLMTVNFVASEGSSIHILHYLDLFCDLCDTTEPGPLGIYEMSNQKNNSTL